MKKNVLLLAAVLSSATLLFGDTNAHELLSNQFTQSQQIVDTRDVSDNNQQAGTKTMVDYSQNPYWAPQDQGYIESNLAGGN